MAKNWNEVIQDMLAKPSTERPEEENLPKRIDLNLVSQEIPPGDATPELLKAMTEVKSVITKKLRLPDGWTVAIFLWPRNSPLVGIRVQEVSCASTSQGYAWLSSDTPESLAICAAVERCLLAITENWPDDEISYELTNLEGTLK